MVPGRRSNSSRLERECLRPNFLKYPPVLVQHPSESCAEQMSSLSRP